MINKYLIFRTDRIGDFLLTAILIRSIKRNDPNSFIKIISSNKNYDYIKSFEMIDEVILLNKGFINKLKLIQKLKKDKYKTIIIHDSKKRSKLISFFLNKELLLTSKINQNISYIDDIKKLLYQLDFNFKDSDLNSLSKKFDYKNKNDFFIKDYILFHFDEKWIYNQYIKKYINIEPSYDDFFSLLKSIISKTNKNLIITTGLKTPSLLNKMMHENLNPKFFFFDKMSIFEIEHLIKKSTFLIACHGAVSHIAAANNVKQIDIIDKSYNYSKWTAHFRNYSSLNRKPFIELSTDIINLL